jgi:hypothetical protein
VSALWTFFAAWAMLHRLYFCPAVASPLLCNSASTIASALDGIDSELAQVDGQAFDFGG